mgnify:CR=1 FL=1
MEDALTRILTPTRRIDVLADVERARAAKRPYVIVFVGVNGVGKSTSLSKVAYYLKSNGFTPMLCACDTFRSGAVEQLRAPPEQLEALRENKNPGAPPERDRVQQRGDHNDEDLLPAAGRA